MQKLPRVAVVDLRGMIMASNSPAARGKVINMEGSRRQLDAAFKVKRLDAVYLNINSPGGAPTQCELITDYLDLKAKEKNVKVYSFVEDMAASGGYWLACAGEKIFVKETSIVGSIGVISNREVSKKNGGEKLSFFNVLPPSKWLSHILGTSI